MSATDLLIVIAVIVNFIIMYFLIQSATKAKLQSTQNDRIIRLLVLIALDRGISGEKIDSQLKSDVLTSMERDQ
jgi:hypothetical protein